MIAGHGGGGDLEVRDLVVSSSVLMQCSSDARQMDADCYLCHMNQPSAIKYIYFPV